MRVNVPSPGDSLGLGDPLGLKLGRGERDAEVELEGGEEGGGLAVAVCARNGVRVGLGGSLGVGVGEGNWTVEVGRAVCDFDGRALRDALEV